MDLDSLYQEIILDHYKHPHHGPPGARTRREVHHVNPTCGDEVTLRVHVADGVVEDVSYDALGCSISQASASVMTDLVIGKPVDEAMAIHETFLTLMQGKGQVEPDEDVLEDGIAFAGVAKFPARVKCALLSLDGLEGRDRPGSGRRRQHQGDQQWLTSRPPTRPSTTSDLPEVTAGGSSVSVDDVTEAMKDVVDPELGINVVDLGLVYGVHLDEDSNCVIDMTLTSAACPLTDVIQDQTNRRSRAWSTTSRSTGSGCRRGARTRSPTTAASSCAPSASTSERRHPLSDDEVSAFWELARVRARLNSAPSYFGPTTLEVVPPPAWSFGASAEQADALLALVLDGTKTATAGALWDYESEGEPLPEVGTLSILLDGSGHPRGAHRGDRRRGGALR